MLINTLSPKDLIRFYLQDSAAPAAVVDAEYAALFDEETVAGAPLRALIVVNGTPLSEPSGFKVLNGDQWFLEFPAELEAAPTSRDDMAFWMYSSGSTGRPKGIVHLQHDMAYTAESFGRHILAIRRRLLLRFHLNRDLRERLRRNRHHGCRSLYRGDQATRTQPPRRPDR
jgi:acyl-coenzyme A synthetase/AMP-(fatty) acid ligase